VIVGMVATRFAGLDGVSLEAAKVAAVIQSAGHEVAWFAGELGAEFTPGLAYPPAHFAGAQNRQLEARAFGSDAPCPEVRERIAAESTLIEGALEQFVAEQRVDVLLPQNALSIPMQLPLGVAIARFLRTTGLPAVAHHHDMRWERRRFSRTCVQDVLDDAFPPVLDRLSHMVINSIAARQLTARRGIVPTLVPNVMDFERPPPPADGVAFRKAAGLTAEDRIILQPTRLIPRKGIETTVELAAALNDPAIKVVFSHPALDEGDAYAAILGEQAARLGVDVRRVATDTPGGPRLADAYAAAHLVSFPSRVEGFGNALLETFYYRRPVLVRRYEVYAADIAPTGVRCIEIDQDLTPDTVVAAARYLEHPGSWVEDVEHNYQVGLRHFSYAAVREEMLPLLESAASRS